MRRPAPKTVWLVGAGASVSHSRGVFPSLLDIPARARALEIVSEKTVAEEPGLRHLTSYLKHRHVGDLLDPAADIDLERVLTLLEIDLAVSPKPRLLLVREYLLRLLRATLLELHAQERDDWTEYRRLAARLGTRDTVVTFNWDVLLDDALGRREQLRIPDGAGAPRLDEPARNAYAQFLLHFSGWGHRVANLGGIPLPLVGAADEDRGYYIKAHGSVDWFYCATRGCRASGAVFPLLQPRGAKPPRCSGCRESMHVLIVPPTLNKRLHDVPLTRRLWTLAAQEVAHATELAVWGYSLPPTDFVSDWLLRHTRATRCRRLVLINPDVADGEFVARFTNALRRSGRPLDVRLFSSFEEYEKGSDVPAESVDWLPESGA